MLSSIVIAYAQSMTDPTVVDVAVYYTPSAREVAGGTDLVKAEIDAAVAGANQAFTDGGLNLKVSLVLVTEVTQAPNRGGLDLYYGLAARSDGFLDEVHHGRDQAAADLIVLAHGGSSGRACLLSRRSGDTDCAIAVVPLGDGGRGLAHELGHLMGLWHDRFEVHQGVIDRHPTPIFAYAYGYVNQRALDDGAAASTRWRTIMAYPNQCRGVGGCTRLLRYSNPNQIYPDPGGDAMGVLGEEHSPDFDGPADAVRTLGQTASVVAGYRSAPAITLTFDAETYTATEGGTAATVTVGLSTAPTRPIDIPIEAAGATSASKHDFIAPAYVTFSASETTKTFTVTAADDGADDDGETVTLAFGDALPRGVTEGTPVAATVTLADNDVATGTAGIAKIELTSDAATAYVKDDAIEVTIWFDRHVVVTGQPQVDLTVGTITRQAKFQSVVGEVLTFAYTVVDDETDANGVSIDANSLTLNGGSIRDSAMNDATLTHSALSDDDDHRVDSVKPSFQSAVVNFDKLTLTFDDTLDANSTPPPSVFTVTVASVDRSVAAVQVVQASVVLTLSPPVSMGEAVTVSYASSQSEASIRDRSGNKAANVPSTTATNETLAPVYDTDADGLIEIANLAQLNAVRYDLDGDSDPDSSGAAAYRAAFPDAFPNTNARLTCSGQCLGYELDADLDLDTNGNGLADSGDTYWNRGQGWEPISGLAEGFSAVFEGNGHAIRNLFINRTRHYVGLFGNVAGFAALNTFRYADIRNTRLIQVDVTGTARVGGLAGTAGTSTNITANHVSGSVSGDLWVGGLVGVNNAWVTDCYSTAGASGDDVVGGLVGWNASVVLASYATGSVSGTNKIGGLAGVNRSLVDSSYATGSVSGTTAVGGLVGYNQNAISVSYSTGRVSGDTNVGGLVGNSVGHSATIDDSYWDMDTSGVTTGTFGVGDTTLNLQLPTRFSGIYESWDHAYIGAAPWHLGTNAQYPALKADLGFDGTATWPEFGYQIRAGPILTATSDSSRSNLSWTGVDLSAWNPQPVVTYSVHRNDGAVVKSLANGLTELSYTDSAVTVGSTYTYQVVAHVGGGVASRSAMEEVTVVATDTTPPTIESIESGATHPTKDPFTVTITFSESVTDLKANEITVSNGTGSSFSGSGSTYRLRVTPAADFEGNVEMTVPAGVAKDGSDNTNEAASATFSVDTRAPAFVATDPATVNGATLTLTFDDTLASTNTPTSAFTVTGGTTRSISDVSVSGAAVQLTVDPPALYGETGIEVDYTAPSRQGFADSVGNKVASFEDQAVTNETSASTVSSEVALSLDTVSVAEGGSAKTVVVTGTLNRSARPMATDMTVEVGAIGDTATEGADFTTVDDLTLTIPAYQTSATARFTLRPANDRIDEQDESLTVRGSTTVSGLNVTPSGGLTIRLADNDEAPSLVLSLDKSSFAEDGDTATVTVGTGSGSTFETAQTVSLSVGGTATETTDYTVSGKTLTLPAGTGTNASTVSATLTGVDDDLDDDDETVVISATHNGVPFGDRRTVTIEDDDDPEVTVSFARAQYRAAEGGHVDVAVTLSAVPERKVSIPVEAEGADGADSADFSISPSSLSFGASETTRTVRVRAADDSAVDPGERVALSFGTPLPDRVSEGGIAQATVTIRDEDFTFVPAFAAGSGTMEPETGVFAADENDGALRLTLELTTPRGVRVEDIPDPVVVTLETRENAGSKGMDEDYATQRRSGTFGDYGEFDLDLSFAPGDFSDDGACGCARAEKAISVDLFDDRVHERVEVFGLRLSRKRGRLSVPSQDITAKIAEDDAEPALTLDANPVGIAEAGGASTVTVSTGRGSTFPSAQTIRLNLSGTATQGTDYMIDATSLALPTGVGRDPSSVTTTVRAMDDPIDDDGETVVLAASRDGVEFARRTVFVNDDDIGSTSVDLSVNPAQVREDAGTTTVRVTASLNADARAQDTDLTVTVGASGDSAVEGTDYKTVPDLALTINAGETTGAATFSLDPTNNDSVEGAKTITVDGSVSGLAVRSADLTLNDDDVASTQVTLTLDPREVSENAGSRAVRVTGTLDGGARPTETVVTVTVGSGGDPATEGEDYAEVPELELTIPANRTDGGVSFALRPTNDWTAEGTETISVRGEVAGLTVTPAELALADDDTASTRLDLSLNPSRVSEGAAPTEVAVTASLDAGARTTDTAVTATVGDSGDSATQDLDYANVSTLRITVPANETTGQTTFTLSPDNDAIAEGAETITVTGRTNGLNVEPAVLTLSDNDTASRIVTLAADPESVSEDTPENVTVTASLNAGARAEDTGVRLTVGAAGDTAVPGTDYERVPERTLTILSGETGGTATFLLEPLDNDSADGARTLSVTGSTTVAELRIEPASGAKIALADDDSPAVLVTPDRLTVVEAESGTYTVELRTRPTADVTVTITGVSGDLSLDKTSLVFTGADWSDPQDVEVTAADDDDSARDPDVTLTHRASGAPEYRGLRTELAVTIRENDPSLVFSATSVTVPEGETATYTVALATEPTAEVTVRIAGASGDLSLDKTRLAFTPGDWDDAQTITVEAAEDDDTSTDAAVTLTHEASGGGYDGVVGTVRATIREDDGDPRPPPPPPPGPGPSPPPSNRPPVATEEMTARILELGDTLELDASEHFRDPDRRRMTFEAESADSAVATVEVDGGAVTVRAADHGATAVTVTAVDDRRARATQSFEVTVGRLVSFASEEVAAAEGDTATLTVAISRPRDAATALEYVVGPDDDPTTADADADDHDGMAGTVVIAAGATQATIAIAVRDDDDIEPPREIFAVTLKRSAEQARDFGLGVAAVRVRIDEGVCDRTRQVRDALRRSLPCARVSESDLAGIRTLDLSNAGLVALQPADFSGLDNLRALDMSGNSLASLPDGVFAGLGELSEARSQDNPGSPFVLRVELARTDGPASAPSPARLAARVRQGAPFPLRVGLKAVGGALSSDASVVATGMAESAPVSVARTSAGATRVELASTPSVPDTRCGRFGRYLCYRGFATAIGAPLILFKDPPEVRGSVPATDLAAENDSIRISLSELFVAADGRPLRYAARSSDPGLAGAEVRGGVLIVVSGEDGREGTATITVTATDADGLSAELTFEVTLESMPRGFMSGWRRALIEQLIE